MSQGVILADEQRIISTAEKLSAGTLYDVSVKPRASFLGARGFKARFLRAMSKVERFVYHAIKRGFDILFGVIGCLFILPLAIVIKIAYMISGDFGSIFFVQKRIGFNGREFKLFKFRTMVQDADEILVDLIKKEPYKSEWKKFQKLKNDPRTSRVGKVLRKTSLDEFPQFFNILKGDMSLVGPRPLVEGELDDHGGDSEIYESVRPGLTSWWAANGRSETDYDTRLEQEYYYAKNCSLWLDLICIAKTAKGVLVGEGAN